MGANVLSRLENCPGCDQAVLNHSFFLLASIVNVPEDPQRLHEFVDALKGRRWTKMLTFQEWEGAKDNVELYGLRCTSDCVTLVVVRSPFELYDSDEIVAVDVLSSEERQSLLTLIKDKQWKTIA